MKCNDCKFAERNDPESDHGSCQIELPAWLQKREGDMGRMVWMSEYSSDSCDLGVLKDTEGL